jgi:hypothetical protein
MVCSMPNKALKRENLQLAVFTPFNILANSKFPLSGALGGTTLRFLLLTNFRFFNIGWVAILFRGFSPNRFVNIANHCRESSNNICVVR